MKLFSELTKMQATSLGIDNGMERFEQLEENKKKLRSKRYTLCILMHRNIHSYI